MGNQHRQEDKCDLLLCISASQTPWSLQWGHCLLEHECNRSKHLNVSVVPPLHCTTGYCSWWHLHSSTCPLIQRPSLWFRIMGTHKDVSLMTSALSPTLQKHRDSAEGDQMKRNPSILLRSPQGISLSFREHFPKARTIQQQNTVHPIDSEHLTGGATWGKPAWLENWTHPNVQGHVIDLIHI